MWSRFSGRQLATQPTFSSCFIVHSLLQNDHEMETYLHRSNILRVLAIILDLKLDHILISYKQLIGAIRPSDYSRIRFSHWLSICIENLQKYHALPNTKLPSASRFHLQRMIASARLSRFFSSSCRSSSASTYLSLTYGRSWIPKAAGNWIRCNYLVFRITTANLFRYMASVSIHMKMVWIGNIDRFGFCSAIYGRPLSRSPYNLSYTSNPAESSLSLNISFIPFASSCPSYLLPLFNTSTLL